MSSSSSSLGVGPHHSGSLPSQPPSRAENDLMNALLVGNADKISMLLESGINPDIVLPNEQKPLHLATDVGHFNIVRLLLLRNANVRGVALKRQTALHIAVIRAKIDIAILLLENGADIDAKGTLSLIGKSTKFTSTIA